MDPEINKSAKTIDKRNLSQWRSTLKSGSAHLPLIFLLCFSITIFSLKAFGQAANLDQVRNGSAASPVSPADWVNGNAGPSNAHFAEGYSIPYRMHVTGLTSGSHVLVIEWDTKDQNGHAIDYITHYNNLDNPVGSHQVTFGHAPETINPTLGIAGLGAVSTFPIPAPSSAGSEVAGQPTSSFNALAASLRLMTIYGGTITAMSYVFQNAPDATTASTKTQLSITFSTTNTQVLLAWGGHIAAEYDWGVGRGATNVNGSPYHTRLISLDGSGGNQDRSLKADAVIIPPPDCGISPAQFACPETASLTFDATGSSTGLGISYVWTLTNGSPSAGAVIQGSNTGFSITVVPIGTDFIAGGTFNLSLTVNKVGAQSKTCSITPAGTIVKVIASASANPTTIDITTAAHNTVLTADIDPASTDPNNANYNYQWVIVTAGTAGVLSNATSRIATYTADVADPNSIQFKVTATQKSAPNCADDALVSVNITSGLPCGVTPQAAVCQGTTTSHTGSPNPKPATAAYTWSLEAFGGGGTTASTLASANGGVTMQVNANESYRIILTQVYDNPALNTFCVRDVTVVPTPTVSAIYNPPGCSENTFSIDIPNSVSGSSYRVTQGGEVTPTYDQTQPGDGGTLNFSGLAAGGGFLVRVTTGTASCTATTNCANSTNSCTSSAITQNKGVTLPVKSITDLPETYKITLESPTKVIATPNPYLEKVRFDLVSGVSGYGTLELYNMAGQRVGIVYQGYIQAGRPFVREYSITKGSKSSIIYVFKVGDQRVTGKLISLK